MARVHMIHCILTPVTALPCFRPHPFINSLTGSIDILHLEFLDDRMRACYRGVDEGVGMRESGTFTRYELASSASPNATAVPPLSNGGQFPVPEGMWRSQDALIAPAMERAFPTTTSPASNFHSSGELGPGKLLSARSGQSRPPQHPPTYFSSSLSHSHLEQRPDADMLKPGGPTSVGTRAGFSAEACLLTAAAKCRDMASQASFHRSTLIKSSPSAFSIIKASKNVSARSKREEEKGDEELRRRSSSSSPQSRKGLSWEADAARRSSSAGHERERTTHGMLPLKKRRHASASPSSWSSSEYGQLPPSLGAFEGRVSAPCHRYTPFAPSPTPPLLDTSGWLVSDFPSRPSSGLPTLPPLGDTVSPISPPPVVALPPPTPSPAGSPPASPSPAALADNVPSENDVNSLPSLFREDSPRSCCSIDVPYEAEKEDDLLAARPGPPACTTSSQREEGQALGPSDNAGPSPSTSHASLAPSAPSVPTNTPQEERPKRARGPWASDTSTRPGKKYAARNAPNKRNIPKTRSVTETRNAPEGCKTKAVRRGPHDEEAPLLERAGAGEPGPGRGRKRTAPAAEGSGRCLPARRGSSRGRAREVKGAGDSKAVASSALPVEAPTGSRYSKAPCPPRMPLHSGSHGPPKKRASACSKPHMKSILYPRRISHRQGTQAKEVENLAMMNLEEAIADDGTKWKVGDFGFTKYHMYPTWPLVVRALRIALDGETVASIEFFGESGHVECALHALVKYETLFSKSYPLVVSSLYTDSIVSSILAYRKQHMLSETAFYRVVDVSKEHEREAFRFFLRRTLSVKASKMWSKLNARFPVEMVTDQSHNTPK